jgi:hypothetical protein
MDYPLVTKLAPQDAMFGLATHKVTIDYTLLAARGAGAALTIQLLPGQTPTQFSAGTAPSGTCPAGTTVRFCGFKLVTAFDFSDAAINSLLMRVGDGNDTDRLSVDKELAVDGTEILNWTETASTQPYAYPIADGIDAVFTAAGGASPTVQEATSGEVEIYLHISNPPDRA